jgi:hypothetical protein
MNPGRGTRKRATRILVLTLAATAALVRADEMRAHADDPKPAARASSGVTGAACVLKGTYPVPKGTAIYDAPAAGRVVATFSGGFQPMQLADFPADPTTGRARSATSTGTGALRIDGWVSPSAIAVFTARDVPIAGGHVWISEAQRVKLVQASAGALTAELTVAGTNGQTVRASAPCDALALQHGTPTAMEVPGNGRGYLSKGGAVELFDEPGGSVVFTLRAADGVQQLFWSTESRAGFVHVRARGSLTVDAWARATSLEPLKKGEMMDQFVPPTSSVAGAQLALDKPPRLVQATHDIVLHGHRDEKERPIGAIESGAEVYVMEMMLGWVNVLPKNLGLMPPDDGGGFWIPVAELPK